MREQKIEAIQSKMTLHANRKRSRSRSLFAQPPSHHRPSPSEPGSDSGDELDLSRELHPIGYFINDREAMLNEVLSVVKGAKFKAMLTSTLRNVDPDKLKRLLLEQLEGMSKKRIKYVLAGQEMEESSDTEDDADDDFEQEQQDLVGGSSKENVHPVPETTKSSPHLTDAAKKMASEADSDDSLDQNGFIQRKTKSQAAQLNRPQVVNIPMGKVEKKTESPTKNKTGGQSQLELLELEMRAKMIKALLKKANQGEETANPVVPEKTAPASEAPKVEIESLVKEEKRLIKAREVLMVSEAKKKEELEVNQRKEQEIRQRLEEHQRQRDELAEKERKAKEAEEEKARKKAQKEEEYRKFLLWKEEKKKKEEARRLQEEQDRQREHQRQTKRKLKQMSEKLDRTHESSDTAIKIKRKKISREAVEDELDLDYSSFEEEDQSASGQQKRRYRRKGAKEEGETSDVPSPSQPQPDREDSLSLSSVSETDDRADQSLAQIRARRLARVEEIREIRRKKKPATEIEEGEVDSEGEHFEPVQAQPEIEEPCEGDSLNDESGGDWTKYDLTSVQKVPISLPTTSQIKPKKVKKAQVKRKGGHVFINDDSDNEKIVSSDEEREAEKQSNPEEPVEQPERKNDGQEPIENEEDQEELESKQKEQLEETKRIEKMEKLREERIRRMHAFQARTEIEDLSNKHDEESSTGEEEEEEKAEGSPQKSQERSQLDEETTIESEEKEKSDPFTELVEPMDECGDEFQETPMDENTETRVDLGSKKVEVEDSKGKDAGFYQSFLEEEQKQIALKQKAEAERQEKEEKEQREKEEKAEMERKMKEKELETTSQLAPVVERTLEEKKLAGVGYWKEQMANQPQEADPEPEISKPQSSSSNQDLPSKADVDRQQEEMESLTWADRWYQNKKVQKVVKDSKMMSRVRTQIKLKEFKLPPPNEVKGEDGTPKVKDLPNVIGSMEEYDKLLGKGLNEEQRQHQQLTSKSNEEDESDEDENDDLWGAIMGGKEDDSNEEDGTEK